MKSITDSYLFSFLAMRRSLVMRAFTSAFSWKIFGKHFSSMTSFLCFHPQVQISIQFWNSRLWNACSTRTRFRVFLHEALIRSRHSYANYFFGNFFFFAGKLRKVTPLSLSFWFGFYSPGRNILAQNWINEFRTERKSFSLWASHQFGQNDVMDMRPSLQDPFKMVAPSVELFTSFPLGSHPLQKLKQRWVTQLNVNFLLVMEKIHGFWSDLLLLRKGKTTTTTNNNKQTKIVTALSKMQPQSLIFNVLREP